MAAHQPAQPLPPPTMASPQPQSNDPADMLLQYFPEAGKLSREDLEEMLKSPAYFDAFFGTLPQTMAMYKEHEELLKSNLEVTSKNMALREHHEALKKETSDAFNDARSLQHKWHNEIVPAQDEVYKRFSSKVQLARLRTACSDQDRLLDQLVRSLQEGAIDMDQFSQQYREARRLYYRRALQTEKFEKGQVDWRE